MTNKCPECNADLEAMVEYSFDHPQHYDGISEYLYKCGHRFGRWSGRNLEGDDCEQAGDRFRVADEAFDEAFRKAAGL